MDTASPEKYPTAVTTFYRFSTLEEDELVRIEARFNALAGESDLSGLIIMGVEGLNATLAGSDETLTRLKAIVRSLAGFSETIFKDSRAKSTPFKRFKIKQRPEIVTLGRPDFVPEKAENNHLSPAEWEAALQEEGVVVIDTRNGYEVEVGKFRGALDPQTHAFGEFGDFIDRSAIPKEQKVLMYCTGGIRCEKAILEMQSRGYENVYQLEGGILNYLQHFPDSQFEGECFVFDHRVAVDQNLEPSSRFSLCPHCGDPGEKSVSCGQCGKSAVICEHCAELSGGKTCSKNCRHHFARNNDPSLLGVSS